ncbi:MAG: hypothetical protein GY851_02215 [bacterium]|nr:hypothetical protein [bacterium]
MLNKRTDGARKPEGNGTVIGTHCNRLRVVLLALVATSLAACFGGCSSFYEKQIKQGVKAHETGTEYRKAVQRFENVLDSQPQKLSVRKHAKQIDAYRDSQIRYGTAAAQKARDDNDLRGAWLLLMQTSLVDRERVECRLALDQAHQVREQIVQEALAEAQAALDRGDVAGAVSWAAQGLWYGGGEEAAALLQEAAIPTEDLGIISQSEVLRTLDVNGCLRTDSLEKIADGQPFAPYGKAPKGAVSYAYGEKTRAVEGSSIPVYFGDVPRYYVVVQEARVKGGPVSQPVHPRFAKTSKDSLRILSRRVSTYRSTEESRRPNAVVNARLWTKSKKAYTKADLVQIMEFADPDGEVPEAVTRIEDTVEPAPTPEVEPEPAEAGDES